MEMRKSSILNFFLEMVMFVLVTKLLYSLKCSFVCMIFSAPIKDRRRKFLANIPIIKEHNQL